MSMLIALLTCPALLATNEAIRQGQTKDRREEHRARRCNLVVSCSDPSPLSVEIDHRQVALKDSRVRVFPFELGIRTDIYSPAIYQNKPSRYCPPSFRGVLPSIPHTTRKYTVRRTCVDNHRRSTNLELDIRRPRNLPSQIWREGRCKSQYHGTLRLHQTGQEADAGQVGRISGCERR